MKENSKPNGISRRRVKLIQNRIKRGITITGSLRKLATRIRRSPSTLSVLQNDPSRLSEETLEEVMMSLKNVISGTDQLSEKQVEMLLRIEDKEVQSYFFEQLRGIKNVTKVDE